MSVGLLAGALVMPASKIAAHGAGALLDRTVLLFGVALTPATLLGPGRAGRPWGGSVTDCP